jgi:hypothetical protein
MGGAQAALSQAGFVEFRFFPGLANRAHPVRRGFRSCRCFVKITKVQAAGGLQMLKVWKR